jgi:hypothetical protein
MYRRAILALAGLTLAVGATSATAQVADKPIRLIVPTPAGGPSDTVARALAQPLAKVLGQPVVIENRPGAGGALAAQAVMAAPADGHTLLWGLASMATLPMLQKSPPFRSMSAAGAGVGRRQPCLRPVRSSERAGKDSARTHVARARAAGQAELRHRHPGRIHGHHATAQIGQRTRSARTVPRRSAADARFAGRPRAVQHRSALGRLAACQGRQTAPACGAAAAALNVVARDADAG